MVTPPIMAPDREPIVNILCSPSTPEELAQQEREKRDWDIFQILLDTLLEGYRAGDVNLLNLLELAVKCGKEFKGDTLPLISQCGKESKGSIPQSGRHRMLGQLIEEATSITPKRNAPALRSNQPLPSSLRQLCVELFKLALQREMNPYMRDELIGKEKEKSAPYYVAQRMIQFGIFKRRPRQSESTFIEQCEKKVANYYAATKK